MLLNMFRAARCSSSGGQIVSLQPLVSSPSVSSMTKGAQNLHSATDITLIWVVVRSWQLKWAEQSVQAGKMTK